MPDLSPAAAEVPAPLAAPGLVGRHPRLRDAAGPPAAGAGPPLHHHPAPPDRPRLRRPGGARPRGAGVRRGAALPAAVLAGAPARRPGAAVPRPRDRRPAVPRAAPAAARDPGAHLHQARPGAGAAPGHPAGDDHRRAQEPARPPAGGPLRPLPADHRGGRPAADRRDVLLGRPDPHRLGVDRPDPPRHHAARGTR